MALRDHFHPPLSLRRHWHAFHHAWIANMAVDLNERLPEGYFAEPNAQFGIEIDVATFEEPLPASALPQSAVVAQPGVGSHPLWIPPAPSQTIPFSLITDLVEVLVYSSAAGPILVGAIELVSPANKDRQAHREAFVSKCEALLHQGLGLVLVDVVTERRGNLHHDLLQRFHASQPVQATSVLYATAYRPVEHAGQSQLAIWQEHLTLGHPLPTLPLWLRDGPCMPIDLDTTYARTCQQQRLPVT